MPAATTAREIAISLTVGVVAFAAGNAAEAALSAGTTHGNPWLVAWTSEILLSSALVVATYLWLHVRNLQGALASLERVRVEVATELRLAASIQRHLLDATEARPSPVAWRGLLQPAHYGVGGDFYDVLTLADGSILILTADVSGKGIPAAIALASARTAFRQIARRTPDLPSLAAALSAAIRDENDGTPYMTAILCQIVPATDQLSYVNAGHPAGRLAGPGGLIRLEPTGPPLGLLPGGRWAAPLLDARAYTLGLLFTDGVAESLESVGDPDAILDDLARRLAAGTPEAACAAVRERVRSAGGSSLAPLDDRTVVAFVPRARHV